MSKTVAPPEPKFIFFQKAESTGKTFVYHVINDFNQEVIGHIKWFGKFRSYSFFPLPDTVYEKVCLRDIANFCEKLMLDRKK